jgi:hypothetical protein
VSTLLELAERCEREGPSQELDISICDAIDIAWDGRAFSSSLDAAVSLVPEGAWRETNGPRRYLNIPSPVPNYWHTEVTTWDPTRMSHGWAATEAMSICAAALRAREHGRGDDSSGAA